MRSVYRLLYCLKVRENFSSFWNKHPALFFGFAIFLGTALAFYTHPLLWLVLIALILSAPSKRTYTQNVSKVDLQTGSKCRKSILAKGVVLFNTSPLRKNRFAAAFNSVWRPTFETFWVYILSLLCFLGAFFLTTYRHPHILLPQEKIKGKGIFHIDQVKLYSSPFHRSILYKGTLDRFESTEGTIFEKLPCNIYLPLFGKRPPAITDYEIEGTLSQKTPFTFVLKPEKKTNWKALSSRFNLAEMRFQAKQAISRYLKQEIADPQARTFLNALATGEIDERILAMEFSKVGLQHLLAISGFHFALVALFCNAFLRLILPHKLSLICLLIVISLYAFFLGNTPSIQRAYIAISLVATSKLFSLRVSGLNALGIGMIIELILTPLFATELSFYLTFLCTVAILLFYPLTESALQLLLPKRDYPTIKGLPFLDKHGLICSTLLRKALALNLAVHCISLPVLLHLFHKFPLLSIAYNLFFPFCVSLSIFLLFLAFLFAPWLPCLSHLVHAVNNAWTSALLQLTSNPPVFLDFTLRFKQISLSFVIFFLIAAFFVGVIFHEKKSFA